MPATLSRRSRRLELRDGIHAWASSIDALSAKPIARAVASVDNLFGWVPIGQECHQQESKGDKTKEIESDVPPVAPRINAGIKELRFDESLLGWKVQVQAPRGPIHGYPPGALRKRVHDVRRCVGVAGKAVTQTPRLDVILKGPFIQCGPMESEPRNVSTPRVSAVHAIAQNQASRPAVCRQPKRQVRTGRNRLPV